MALSASRARVVATGLLHDATRGPEKSLAELDPDEDSEEIATLLEAVEELQAALDDEYLLPLPDGSDYGYVADRRMGELAPKLGVERDLYRALRPEALATLVYMASRVQSINGGEGDLTGADPTLEERVDPRVQVTP